VHLGIALEIHPYVLLCIFRVFAHSLPTAHHNLPEDVALSLRSMLGRDPEILVDGDILKYLQLDLLRRTHILIVHVVDVRKLWYVLLCKTASRRCCGRQTNAWCLDACH
jgi:hypothetical protein